MVYTLSVNFLCAVDGILNWNARAKFMYKDTP